MIATAAATPRAQPLNASTNTTAISAGIAATRVQPRSSRLPASVAPR